MKVYTHSIEVILKHHLSMLLMILFLSFPLNLNAADTIYWGSEGTGTIQAANLDGSTITPINLFSVEGAPCGVAIDSAAGKIYWANFRYDGIRVANLDGSGIPQTLFGDEGSVCGVAINPASGKIYWANFTHHTIRVGNLNGTEVASTLFEEPPGSAPSGVVIDPGSGKIYWSNQFSNEIRIGNLDGTEVAQTLISGENNPIGVAINPATGKIYWAQLGGGLIRAANLDGSNITTLYSLENGPGGVAIDPKANKIYWANFYSSSIRVGDLDGTGLATTLYSSDSFSLFPVLLKAPSSTIRPNISGGTKVGKKLTCENGGWANDLPGAFLFQAPGVFQYQWKLNGANIGTQQKTHIPTIAGSYTCLVTASNKAGSASKLSGIKKVTLK